ncbi:MAG: hypothetical protein ACRYG7_01755 [Janthinobacterium lividum]
MLYVLWTALNGVALCYFFAASIASIKAICERAGWLPLLVVIFGLLSFHSSSQEAAASAHQPTGSGVVMGLGENTFPPVEEYYVADIKLIISYKQAGDSSKILTASSLLTGLTLGNRWEPTATGGTIQGNQLHYYADGIMHWCLLGATLYREHKHLTGIVPLR